jgi:hypothetical protein
MQNRAQINPKKIMIKNRTRKRKKRRRMRSTRTRH